MISHSLVCLVNIFQKKKNVLIRLNETGNELMPKIFRGSG